MNKIILVSSLSILLSACGGSDKVQESAENSAKDSAKKSVEVAEKVTTDATKAISELTPEVNDKKAAVNEAKKITKSFGGALKKELKAAIKSGGHINALDVCNTEADPIAEKSAKEFNASVSRVSLKNRNPKNVPNDWQKTVLENFDARAAKGEDVSKMGFSEVVEKEGHKQLRFMKALPTGGLCLDCHGSNIEADVQAKITELYPEDKAVGYEKGQVRGAVVILKSLN